MTSPGPRQPPLPELVAMVAALMALNALGIDIMLPALPAIAADFGVTRANDQQLVIVVYALAFGFGQLVYGPLSDSLGRRPVLLAALLGYLAATVASLLAPNFDVFILSRAAQGFAAAAARVVAVAIVRDLMSGREMARVMSMVMMVFMIVPIAAPGLGQLILFAGPWRWTFAFLLLGAIAVLVWTHLRLPETRPKEARAALSFQEVLRGYGAVLGNRTSLGYTLASSFAFGGLFAFLAMSQQIYVDVFHLGSLFPLAFASVAGAMAVSSFVNSRAVSAVGMRRLSHGALIAFVGISAVHSAVLLLGVESIWVFLAFILPAMLAFGMIGANFSAIVMEPMGAQAGSAAAFNGFATSTISATIGGLVGQTFNGTAAPLILGHMALGAMALLIVFVTERGRLFQSTAQQ